MDFRPIDVKLIHECNNNPSCKKCKMRVGCPIRKDFYVNDIDYEFFIQSIECSLNNIFQYEKEINFEWTQFMRVKRREEIERHPWFVYP